MRLTTPTDTKSWKTRPVYGTVTGMVPYHTIPYHTVALGWPGRAIKKKPPRVKFYAQIAATSKGYRSVLLSISTFKFWECVPT